jgi:hypothetical protein
MKENPGDFEKFLKFAGTPEADIPPSRQHKYMPINSRRGFSFALAKIEEEDIPHALFKMRDTMGWFSGGVQLFIDSRSKGEIEQAIQAPNESRDQDDRGIEIGEGSRSHKMLLWILEGRP